MCDSFLYLLARLLACLCSWRAASLSLASLSKPVRVFSAGDSGAGTGIQTRGGLKLLTLETKHMHALQSQSISTYLKM